ncbi:MAG TPA: hypothetical protein VGL81_18690 [Polyangiaceae bacterium]
MAYGSAATAAASTCAVALVAACGSASAGASIYGYYDGGPFDGGLYDGAGMKPDAFTADAAVDASDASANRPTTALFVQASPSLPDVRLCWGTGGAVAPVVPFPGDGVMPGSNYPGIPLGGVVSMGDASALTDGFLLYAIDAENLARIEQNQETQYTCDELICGPGTNQPGACLRYNLDYWAVGAGPYDLVSGASNVVALGGCLPGALDPAASPAVCGATWSAMSGNLSVQVLQLEDGSTATGGLAVEAAQLSPGLATLAGDGGVAVVSFGAQGDADASLVATLQAEGVLAAPTVVDVGTDLSAYGQLGFAVDVPGFDGGAGHLWMSLADSQQLVDPMQDPTLFFGQPRTYLLAVLGDPNAPHAFATGGDAGYDGKGLHLLVVAAPSPALDAGDE